jgi:hypothetical protein
VWKGNTPLYNLKSNLLIDKIKGFYAKLEQIYNIAKENKLMS